MNKEEAKRHDLDQAWKYFGSSAAAYDFLWEAGHATAYSHPAADIINFLRELADHDKTETWAYNDCKLLLEKYATREPKTEQAGEMPVEALPETPETGL